MASPCQRSKLPQHPRILLATLMRLISSDTEKVLVAPDSSPFHTPPRTPKRSEFATPTRLNRTPKRLFSTNNGKSVQVFFCFLDFVLDQREIFLSLN